MCQHLILLSYDLPRFVCQTRSCTDRYETVQNLEIRVEFCVGNCAQNPYDKVPYSTVLPFSKIVLSFHALLLLYDSQLMQLYGCHKCCTVLGKRIEFFFSWESCPLSANIIFSPLLRNLSSSLALLFSLNLLLRKEECLLVFQLPW